MVEEKLTTNVHGEDMQIVWIVRWAEKPIGKRWVEKKYEIHPTATEAFRKKRLLKSCKDTLGDAEILMAQTE